MSTPECKRVEVIVLDTALTLTRLEHLKREQPFMVHGWCTSCDKVMRRSLVEKGAFELASLQEPVNITLQCGHCGRKHNATIHFDLTCHAGPYIPPTPLAKPKDTEPDEPTIQELLDSVAGVASAVNEILERHKGLAATVADQATLLDEAREDIRKIQLGPRTPIKERGFFAKLGDEVLGQVRHGLELQRAENTPAHPRAVTPWIEPGMPSLDVLWGRVLEIAPLAKVSKEPDNEHETPSYYISGLQRYDGQDQEGLGHAEMEGDKGMTALCYALYHIEPPEPGATPECMKCDGLGRMWWQNILPRMRRSHRPICPVCFPGD